MPLTYTTRNTMDVLQPADSKWAQFTIAVPLKESTTYPQGCLLEQGTVSGKYQPYSSGTPALLLKRACITDASGNITFGTATGGMEFGQTYPTADCFYAGLFRTADLPQAGTGAIDANAVSATSNKAIGKLIMGTLAAGLLLVGGHS
jgi:hypothetical protein